METVFHKSERLEKGVLQSLMQRNDHPATIRFSVMNTLFLLASVGAVFSWTSGSWLAIVIFQLLFGLLCCSQFACLHETAHGTAFQSKSKNKLAAFISGITHIYPSHLFRNLHFTHHRHTHVPGLDPEISFGNRAIPSYISTLPTYLGWLTGLPFLSFKVMMIISGALGMPELLRKNIFPFVNPAHRLKIAIECLFALGVYGTITFLALYVNAGFWGLIIGQVVGHCLLASYLTAEHNGLPHEGSILEKTRSMQTSKWVKWLMWNMPYHAEHHAYPAIPFHALPTLHEEIKSELVHHEQNHRGFHTEVLRNLFSNKKK